MRVPALALALLALPGATAAQWGGDAGHASRAVDDAPALDVVGETSLWADGHLGDLRHSPLLLPDGDGYVGAVERMDPFGCLLLHLDGLGAVVTTQVPACEGNGGATFVLAVEDGLRVLCRRFAPAASPLVLAVRADGSAAWSLRSDEVLQGMASATTWSCGTGAVRDGHLVVGLYQDPTGSASEVSGRHAIVSLNLTTGAEEWRRTLAASDLAVDALGPGLGLHPRDDPYPAFVPLTVTATASGYVVVGDLGGAKAAALLLHDGTWTGIEYAGGSFAGRPNPPTQGTIVDATEDQLPSARGSGWALARGSVAYVALGEEVVSLDPSAGSVVDRAVPALPFPFEAHEGLGPLRWQDLLLVPVENGLVALQADGLAVAWEHRVDPGSGYRLWDAAVAGADVWVVGASSGAGPVAERLRGADGALLQRLALNLTLVGTFTFQEAALRLVPQDDGFLVADRTGHAVRLAARPAFPPPAVEASDAYPARGEPVRLDVAAPQGSNVTVFWGNGEEEVMGASGAASTAYPHEGTYTVRVTAAASDSRTSTRVLAIHVGATPPARLSLVQRAFEPENQETTWGLIGLAVAFLGGVGAYAVRAWRRRGIARDLRHLDGLRARSVDEPVESLRELRRYRRELRSRAAAGRLEGAEFASLAQETDALARALRHRILTGFEGRLGARLHQAVDAALADGVLSAAEVAALQKGLAAEMGLTTRERAAFADLLAEWP